MLLNIKTLISKREVCRITRMADDAMESGCKESDVAMAVFNELHRCIGLTGDRDEIFQIAEFSTSIIKGIKEGNR